MLKKVLHFAALLTFLLNGLGLLSLHAASLNQQEKPVYHDANAKWPNDAVYADACVKRKKEAMVKVMVRLENDLLSAVEIRRLPPDHPAYRDERSYGLFSHARIAKGAYIAEYTGRYRLKRERSKSSRYLLKCSDNLYIDAENYGNETRYVNDYRGVMKSPNSQYYKIDCKEHFYKNVKITSRVVVKARRDIEPGEEIVVNYGRGYCKQWGIVKED